MRIAIDARMIHPGSMHGIARYVFQLLNCLRDRGRIAEGLAADVVVFEADAIRPAMPTVEKDLPGGSRRRRATRCRRRSPSRRPRTHCNSPGLRQKLRHASEFRWTHSKSACRRKNL